MHVWLFRELAIDLDATAAVAVRVQADLPQQQMATTRDATITRTGRHVARISMGGTTKGQLISFRLQPAGRLILYGAQVYARRIGDRDSWRWYVLPVVPTGEAWRKVPLPIMPTPEAFSSVRLPITPTPEAFTPVRLPIPVTAEDWRPVRLPIVPTPEDFASVRLPIRATPEEFGSVTLPIKQSAVLPTWVDLPESQ